MGLFHSRRNRQVGSLAMESGVPLSVEMVPCGLVNVGNTCYINAVLQALYICDCIRERVIHGTVSSLHGSRRRGKKKYLWGKKTYPAGSDGLMYSLRDLFVKMVSQEKQNGFITPRQFVAQVGKEASRFGDPLEQQDAHEFLDFLINNLDEQLKKKERMLQRDIIWTDAPSINDCDDGNGTDDVDGNENSKEGRCSSWVSDIMEGVMAHDTCCSGCKTVTTSTEVFKMLSVEIDDELSVEDAIRKFGEVERMEGDDRFFCDKCNTLCDAERSSRLTKLPRVLLVHLKRFRFDQKSMSRRKMYDRVPFTSDLLVGNNLLRKRSKPSDKAGEARGSSSVGYAPVKRVSHENEDGRAYRLSSLVTHIGSSPIQGHYVTVANTKSGWMLFDDEDVCEIDEDVVHSCAGSGKEGSATDTQVSYILLYVSSDTP